MQNTINVANHDIAEPWWGLKPTVTLCFGARLVQEGNRLITWLTAPASPGHSAMRIYAILTRHFRCCSNNWS